jgi:hypothetical protein
VDIFGSPHPTLPRKRGRGRGRRPRELGRGIIHKGGRGHFEFDFLKSEVDAMLLVRSQDSGPDQGFGVGATADDVLAKEPAVNR